MILSVPIHFFLHRRVPTIDVDPIHAFGPSQLDFEYVKYGLHNWPWRNWLLYSSIVIPITLHTVDGTAIISKSLFGWLQRKWRLAAGLACVALPTLLGLYELSKEPLMILPSMERQYDAAYRMLWIFKL